MQKHTYSRPSGGNAFQQFAGSGREIHPLEVDYKKLKVGGRLRFRFLDLTPDSAAVFEGREVGIINRQNGSMMAIKLEIPGEYDRNREDGSYKFTPDPGLRDLVDHAGTPVLSCKQFRLYRCPVWVYYEQDENGKVTDIDALRYLEFTQGLRDSMDELVAFQNGVGAFNDETGRPDYDVDLAIVKGEGTIPKNYKFEVVYLDPKTKKQHQNFGVEAEDVLESVIDEIRDEWPALMDALWRQTTFEDFAKRVAPPRDAAGKPSVSSKPGFGRAAPDPEPQDEHEESAPPARPTGRRYGGR